jgi:hypothetical protein
LLFRYGRNMCILGWHEIRQALADALPDGVVELGTKVTGYTEEDDETVTVNFEVSLQPPPGPEG